MGTPWLDDDRDTVTVTGADAMTYLQSQLSQEIRDLEVGDVRWTFLLEPNGRIDVLARVTRVADDDLPARHRRRASARRSLARVNRFKIRVRADVELTASTGTGRRSASRRDERADRGWMAPDGRRDRRWRDDPGRDGPERGGRQLQEGLLPRPGAGRADGQPGARSRRGRCDGSTWRRAWQPAIRSSTPTATRWVCSRP